MKVVPYARVSTPMQVPGHGYQRQDEAIRAKSARKYPDAFVTSTFFEVRSGTLPVEKRPILRAAIDSLEDGDVLMVEDASRLTREGPAGRRRIEAEVEARGARIEEVGTKIGNEFKREISDIFDQYYRDRARTELDDMVVRHRDQY